MSTNYAQSSYLFMLKEAYIAQLLLHQLLFALLFLLEISSKTRLLV